MVSKIIQLDTSNLNSIASDLFTIPESQTFLLKLYSSPYVLSVLPLNCSDISLFTLNNSELFFLSQENLCKYSEIKKRSLQHSQRNEIESIGNLKSTPKALHLFQGKFYLLYDKKIQIASGNLCKILHEITTFLTMFQIFDDGESVFVTSETKIFKVAMGFLIEVIKSEAPFFKVILIKENPGLMLICFQYYFKIFKEHNGYFEIFHMQFDLNYEEIFFLNEEALLKYNKKTKLLNAFYWNAETDEVYGMYEIQLETPFDLQVRVEEEVIYFVSMETGYIAALFFENETKKFFYCYTSTGVNIERIEFLHHYNNLDRESHWSGDAFIEVIVQSSGKLFIFFIKVDFRNELAFFYSKGASPTVNVPRIPQDYSSKTISSTMKLMEPRSVTENMSQKKLVSGIQSDSRIPGEKIQILHNKLANLHEMFSTEQLQQKLVNATNKCFLRKTDNFQTDFDYLFQAQSQISEILGKLINH